MCRSAPSGGQGGRIDRTQSRRLIISRSGIETDFAASRAVLRTMRAGNLVIAGGDVVKGIRRARGQTVEKWIDISLAVVRLLHQQRNEPSKSGSGCRGAANHG